MSLRVFVVHAFGGGVFCVNDDDSVYFDSSGHVDVDPQKVEVAKTNRESWPAENFPEGNWGPVDHGCQMSLRLDKPTYTNPEPINAVVLVRKLTNDQNHLTLFQHSNRITGWSINYSVFPESSPAIALNPSHAEPTLTMPSSIGFSVRTGSQRKFSDQLSDMYDLTNGVYYVQASVKGYSVMEDTNGPALPEANTNNHVILPGFESGKPPKLDFFELKSAKVRIEVK